MEELGGDVGDSGGHGSGLPDLEDVLEEIPAQEEDDDEKEGGENEDDEKAMEMILREHERDNHDQTTAP